MEEITQNEFDAFCTKVIKARKLKNLPNLHAHDLKTYCNTLINGCSIYQLSNSMECSDRVDLVVNDPNEDSYLPLGDFAEKFQAFTKNYLGLELVLNGDPRGSAFKLIVDASLGDSWGDQCHLCVPCVDAYQSF